MNRVKLGLMMSGTLLGMVPGGAVSAAAENLPWTDGGAGPSDFEVQLPYSPVCGGSGLGFWDNEEYGFNHASMVGVGETAIGSAALGVNVTTIGTDSIATYTEPVGDLTVTVSYRFTDDNIARTLVTITNNGASDVTDLPVNFIYEHGDDYTIRAVDGGSWRDSGDWFTASEDDVPNDQFDNYKAVFHLPDGPGAPESMASVNLCAGPAVNLSSVGVYQFLYNYLVDIPAGGTRSVLSFVGMALTANDVGEKAASFSASSLTPGSGILSDLSSEDACLVVNWDFCGGGGQPSYDIDIDIEHYMRESDLPDTL